MVRCTTRLIAALILCRLHCQHLQLPRAVIQRLVKESVGGAAVVSSSSFAFVCTPDSYTLHLTCPALGAYSTVSICTRRKSSIIHGAFAPSFAASKRNWYFQRCQDRVRCGCTHLRLLCYCYVSLPSTILSCIVMIFYVIGYFYALEGRLERATTDKFARLLANLRLR